MKKKFRNYFKSFDRLIRHPQSNLIMPTLAVIQIQIYCWRNE